MAFGRKAAKKAPVTCLLLGRDSGMLARGVLRSAETDPNIQVEIQGDGAEKVAAAGIVQVIPTNAERAPRMGRVMLRQGALLVLEPMRALGEAVRQNFRIPVDFETYVYPRGAARAFVRALDLSCGGIALCSAHPFEVGETAEVVIPITAEGPLIVECEFLRRAPLTEPIWRYGAKFVNLIHDQEAALREAVFQTQMQQMQTRKK